MALQKNDIDKIISILNGKISDKSINKIIDQINTASFYYEQKDSQFNRPTVGKLFALLVFLFCMTIFVIQPLFFQKKGDITNIANSDINESVKLGGLPPLSSFTYNISLKDNKNDPQKSVIEISDSRGNIISRADLTNGYGTAIFGDLGNGLTIKKDLPLITQANGVLSEDQKDNIKEMLLNGLKYDIYIPEFKSFNYGTDNIISSEEQ